MRPFLLTVLISCITSFAFSQYTFEKWEAESKTNQGLLPRYGLEPKSPAKIKSDSDYVKKIMDLQQFKTRRDASDHLISLGFQYYYKYDFKTAMYRFNQAYLLDPGNTDIFWGYGAIYMALERPDLAKQQYEDGLAIDSMNTHLMTDLATYYMGQYYLAEQMPKNDIVKDPKAFAKTLLDSTLHYLNKSYRLDAKDVNTCYKLSVAYWAADDCTNARKYFDEAKTLGGAPITKEFTQDLEKKCK